MGARVFSASIFGFDCQIVEVEVEIVLGLPSMEIVGLPDATVSESKQRVYAAIKNTGKEFPRKRKIINLAPANLKKHGPSFDLPIAIGLLLASKQLVQELFEKGIIVGELALDGRVKPVSGILAIADAAKKKNFLKIFVPQKNASEASLVDDIEVYPISHLKDFFDQEKIQRFDKKYASAAASESEIEISFEDIKGQEHAKRGLVVAAAGSHNILMRGPPGTGKTLLAKSLKSILPPLNFNEAIEVTKIYSIAGKISVENPLIKNRPFRAVHHTASSVSIIGGGQIPKPGEISLAHRGILFFDEIPEFPSHVLEVLRQPMEEGKIAVNRASYSTVFPSRFMFVGAMNPCPCGFLGDPDKKCICMPRDLNRYRKKLSGPLLDRIDIFIEVPRLPHEKLISSQNSGSGSFKNQVEISRKIQQERFRESRISLNSEMQPAHIKKYCKIEDKAENLLKIAVNEFNLSPRSYFKILKLSRTIADLEQKENIEIQHVAEALQYRPRLNLGF